MRWLGTYGLIAAMLAFPQAPYAGTLYPKVLVSVAPLKPYVDQILGGIAQSKSLVRPGQDPHNFSLSPSEAQALDTAEVLIVPDAAMSPLVMRQAAAHPKLRVIELSKLAGANPLPYATENPWLLRVKHAAKDPDADENTPSPFHPVSHKVEADRPATVTVDPHFWLDPERMAAIALPLADAIAEFSPDNKSQLDSNAREMAQHLRRDVIPAMQSMLRTPVGDGIVMGRPELPFITYHAAYQYFLARFHVEHQGEITVRPEDYLGAKSLDTLLNTAKQVRIHCVISEADTGLVRRIASLAEAKLVVLSPEQLVDATAVPPADWVKNDYDRVLQKIAIGFAGCLQ